MAKWRKKHLTDGVPYQKGLEDGFELRSHIPKDVDVKNLIFFDNFYERFSSEADFDLFPFIQTLEGRHYISHGDFIMTGIKGERYPIKADILHATYEEVI